MPSRLPNFYSDKRPLGVQMLHKELDAKVQKHARLFLKAKEQWMERMMKENAHPAIFKCAKEKRHLRFVMRYINRSGIRIEETPQETRFMVGDSCKGVFRYVWQKPQLPPPK